MLDDLLWSLTSIFFYPLYPFFDSKKTKKKKLMLDPGDLLRVDQAASPAHGDGMLSPASRQPPSLAHDLMLGVLHLATCCCLPERASVEL